MRTGPTLAALARRLSDRLGLPIIFRDLVLNVLIASSLVPTRFRYLALRAYGLQVERCQVSPGVWIGGRELTIREGAIINYHCFIDTSARVTIGRNSGLGMRSMVVSSTHHMGGHGRRYGPRITLPVTIGDGVWVGAGVTILPGVTIGDGAVIGAGSVVTQDCAADTIYAGSPARALRALD